MRNLEMKVEGKKCIITILDITKDLGLSGSGKTHIVASTDGPISMPGNDDIKVGLNVYKK
jgi:hypothetical protein